MGDPHPLFLTADGSAGAYGKGLGLISLNSGLPRSCCRLQWSNLNLTRPIAILLFGDSNDRKLVVSAAATLGMTQVWPSPLGNCTSADGSVKVDETAQRRNDQCPVYGKGMLVLAHFPLDGTVLYMDEGGDPNAKLTPNEYPSMRHNTTGPALRAKRNLERWLGRPPDLITVHSSLRDVYSMCRKAAPGKPERGACAVPEPSSITMPAVGSLLFSSCSSCASCASPSDEDLNLFLALSSSSFFLRELLSYMLRGGRCGSASSPSRVRSVTAP